MKKYVVFHVGFTLGYDDFSSVDMVFDEHLGFFQVAYIEQHCPVMLIAAGMMNSPGMQSMIQQLSSNPQLMQNMMQSPLLTSVMQELSSNPSTAQQVRAIFTESF